MNSPDSSAAIFGITSGLFGGAMIIFGYSSYSPFARYLPNKQGLGCMLLASCAGAYFAFAFCPNQSTSHSSLQVTCGGLLLMYAIYTHSQFCQGKRPAYTSKLIAAGLIFHGIWDMLMHSKLKPWDTSADTSFYSPSCFFVDTILGLWYYATRNEKINRERY